MPVPYIGEFEALIRIPGEWFGFYFWINKASPYIPNVGGVFMRKNGILFTIGGGAYVALELVWRGRSHWTMFALGGGCFLAIGELGRRFPKVSLGVRSMLGSGICTAGELLTGLVFNRDYAIWDYRQLPGNFLGQICLLFTVLWVPVSALAAVLFERLDRLIPQTARRG